MPVGDLQPPPDAGSVETVEVKFDGSECAVAPAAFPGDTDVRIEFDNRTERFAMLFVEIFSDGGGLMIAANPGQTSPGYVKLAVGRPNTFDCFGGFFENRIEGPTVSIGDT